MLSPVELPSYHLSKAGMYHALSILPHVTSVSKARRTGPGEHGVCVCTGKLLGSDRDSFPNFHEVSYDFPRDPSRGQRRMRHTGLAVPLLPEGEKINPGNRSRGPSTHGEKRSCFCIGGRPSPRTAVARPPCCRGDEGRSPGLSQSEPVSSCPSSCGTRGRAAVRVIGSGPHARHGPGPQCAAAPFLVRLR